MVSVGIGTPSYRGKHGLTVKAERLIAAGAAGDFDAVIIPGGYAPDRLRRHRAVIDFLSAMNDRLVSVCAF